MLDTGDFFRNTFQLMFSSDDLERSSETFLATILFGIFLSIDHLIGISICQIFDVFLRKNYSCKKTVGGELVDVIMVDWAQKIFKLVNLQSVTPKSV